MRRYHKKLKFKIVIPLIIGEIALLFLVISISLISYKKFQKDTLEKLDQKILLMNNELNGLFENAEKIYFLLKNEQLIQELGSYRKENKYIYYDEYILRKSIEEKLTYLLEINSTIDSIYLYFESIDTLLTSEYGSYRKELDQEYHLVKVIKELDMIYKWIGAYKDEISNKSYISLVGKTYLTKKPSKENVFICINYNISVFKNILEKLKLTTNTRIILWDKDGNVIASNNEVIDDELMIKNFITKEGERFIDIKYKNEDYYLINQKELINNGGVTLLVPHKELWKEEIMFRNITLMIVMIVIGILMIGMVHKVIKHVDRPLEKLVNTMKRIERGDLNSYITEERDDEFGYLYSNYNQMLKNLNRLIEESYKNELIKKEMKLNTLQKQINPHFLYNTLDTISCMAQSNQMKDVNDTMKALADMYRITFNKGRDLIKCKDMIYGIQCYLMIYKLKKIEGLDFKIEVDKELENYYVLNLVIQTIVENAIVHGILDLEEKGEILVKAVKELDNIQFVVKDNGVGMGKEKLELLILSLDKDTEEESGLKNVQKRIKLYYGEEYGITIDSTLHIGTKVTIRLPCIKDVVNNG